MTDEATETVNRSGEPEQPEAAEPTELAETGTTKRKRNPYTLGAMALVVVTAVCAAVFGGLWAYAALGGAAQYAQARDTVLRVAKGAAVNFTSVDYRHLDQYQKAAEASTTGPLHESLTKSIGQYKKQLGQSKLVVKGSVLQAAVSSLDTHKGTADVLVVMKTVTTRQGGKPQPQRLPMTLKLQRVNGKSWKVNAIGGNASSSAIPGQ